MNMLRNKFILKYIKNKGILDLGFLGENKNNYFSNLHKFILDNASKVLGVDIQEKKILELKNKGFGVIYDDVINLNRVKELKKKFDVIVAGELIEHLENPGQFLDNLKILLKKEGKIIFSTPNIFGLRYIIRHIIFDKENPYWKNRMQEIKYGHVLGFSKLLLENLLLRDGFKIIDFSYVIKDEYKGLKGNIEKILSFIFPRFSPQLAYVVESRGKE